MYAPLVTEHLEQLFYVLFIQSSDLSVTISEHLYLRPEVFFRFSHAYRKKSYVMSKNVVFCGRESTMTTQNAQVGSVRSVVANLSRLFHWGPLIAISIIGYISTIGFFAALLWWPPLDVLGQVNLCVYLTHIPLIVYSFLKALVVGPGFVPFGWRPKSSQDEMFLQFCLQCNGFKPPRSHHCRKCQRCVMKMDHHCPWINTCCGHLNHVSFVAFLFFVPIGESFSFCNRFYYLSDT